MGISSGSSISFPARVNRALLWGRLCPQSLRWRFLLQPRAIPGSLTPAGHGENSAAGAGAAAAIPGHGWGQSAPSFWDLRIRLLGSTTHWSSGGSAQNHGLGWVGRLKGTFPYPRSVQAPSLGSKRCEEGINSSRNEHRPSRTGGRGSRSPAQHINLPWTR